MAEESAVWSVVQRWLDLQAFPPSQAKLARAVGVHRSAVSDWKTGKTHPNPENLLKLSQLMEPTLGPRAYTLLVMAITADLMFGMWPGIDTMLERLPADFYFEPVPDRKHYGIAHNLRGTEADIGSDQVEVEMSGPSDTPSDAIAADEQESSIAGESEESDTP